MAIIKSAEGEEKHQHIYGGIGADGSKLFGEGFQSVKEFTGSYKIQFDQPFAKKPAPVCTINGSQSTTNNLSICITEILPESFTCVTSTPESAVNCAFTFIAFGDAQ